MVDEDGSWDLVDSENMTNAYAAKLNVLKVDIPQNIFPDTDKNGADVVGWNYASYSGRRAVIWADGVLAWFSSQNNCNRTSGTLSNICGYIYVDVNGKPAPNKIGRDYFAFWLYKNSGGNLILTPIGNNDGYTWTSTLSEACTNYVLANNKLL